MFKIGVGPSSSHTLGPWRAAQMFTNTLDEKNILNEVQAIEVLLYGSLAKTGVGHGTSIAVQLGLSGDDPVTFDVENIDAKIADIKNMGKILLAGRHEINFTPSDDIEFLFTETLPYHPNALTFLVSLKDGNNFAETYYSIGGGFVMQETKEAVGLHVISPADVALPFPINTAYSCTVRPIWRYYNKPLPILWASMISPASPTKHTPAQQRKIRCARFIAWIP